MCNGIKKISNYAFVERLGVRKRKHDVQSVELSKSPVVPEFEA